MFSLSLSSNSGRDVRTEKHHCAIEQVWNALGRFEGGFGEVFGSYGRRFWEVRGCFWALRSNFNSRGVDSRELFWFFGHSSLSHHALLTKIGGNASYKPPGPA